MFMNSRLPKDKLSITKISSPSRCSLSITAHPIKPAPPVTKVFIVALQLIFYTVHPEQTLSSSVELNG